MRRTPAVLLTSLLSAGLLTGCGGEVPEPQVSPPATSTPDADESESSNPSAGGVPRLKVEVVADGLEHGWDLGFLPDGQVLVSERRGRFSLISGTAPGADVTRVRANLGEVYAEGEGGLMGMVLHPDFAESRQFTTCHDHQSNGEPDDIRLVTWRLSDDGTSATRVKDLLTGLPVAVGGRHSGCRPTIAADGALIVGTGDTAVGTYPQDRTNLGGKTLRLDLKTGRPLPDNPFADSSNRRERYVWTYGHRNVQGVAIRPGTDQIFTAEHGPQINDEVNLIRKGANYGWDPSQGGTVEGYDESVPMTDRQRFPKAVPAVWESGGITEAVCAATFLEGDQWGAYDGALVVTALKGAKLLVLRLEGDRVTKVDIPKALTDDFGRLRAARLGPDGALYVTTTNGADDQLLKITPA